MRTIFGRVAILVFALFGSVGLGGGGAPPILRYEIACKGGGGYIIDAPAPGSTAVQSSLDCDEAKAAGVACTLADKKHG